MWMHQVSLKLNVIHIHFAVVRFMRREFHLENGKAQVVHEGHLIQGHRGSYPARPQTGGALRVSCELPGCWLRAGRVKGRAGSHLGLRDRSIFFLAG